MNTGVLLTPFILACCDSVPYRNQFNSYVVDSDHCIFHTSIYIGVEMKKIKQKNLRSKTGFGVNQVHKIAKRMW